MILNVEVYNVHGIIINEDSWPQLTADAIPRAGDEIIKQEKPFDHYLVIGCYWSFEKNLTFLSHFPDIVNIAHHGMYISKILEGFCTGATFTAQIRAACVARLKSRL